MPDFTRKRLRHGIPEWVEDGAIYFITINTTQRGINTLAIETTALGIKESVQVYADQHKWHPKLIVIMPDHIHMLVSLNTAQYSIKQIFAPWKSYLHRTHKIEWQDAFFEHRIRDRSSLEEKEQYLMLNPVRAELVETEEEWPYTWREADFSI